MDTILIENAMRDAEELLQELSDPLSEGDIGSKEYGMDWPSIGTRYVETYNGDNSFVSNMKEKLLVYKKLTVPQLRVTLKIWREELLGIETGTAPRDVAVDCYRCGKNFPNMQTLLDHKEKEHGKTVNGKFVHAPGCMNPGHTEDEVCETKVKEEAVIENQTGLLKLDLTDLPDGRYAVPDLSGKNDYVFLMVRRVKKTIWRDKRYVWGKIITGGEWAEAGTIEVKEWSSDAKRLCGQQKPGDYYRGEFEVELKYVLAGPEPWSRLFGQMVGCCGRCGKTLTDEISRSDGFGPECITKTGYWTTRPQDYTVRDDSGRLYCRQHDRYDCPCKQALPLVGVAS
jgi:hypothetical protein